MHEADKPDAVSDFPDTHSLACEDGAEVDLAPSDTDAPALGDLDCAVVEGVLRGLRRGIGACGGCIDIRGIQAAEGLVRAFMVVYLDKLVEDAVAVAGS